MNMRTQEKWVPPSYARNVTKITLWPVSKSLKASKLLVGAINRQVLCHFFGYYASQTC